MKTTKIIYLLILIISCSINDIMGQNLPEKAKLPVTGAEFEYLKKGNGIKGKIGDYVEFGLIVFGNDGSVLADRRAGNPAVDQIREADTTMFPIMELVYSLSVGDSVRIIVPLEEGTKSPELAHLNSLIYIIKCDNIIDQATMQLKMAEEQKLREAKMEEGKIKETKVATDVAELLKKYNAGELKKSIIKTKSGLEYFVIEKAKGEIIKANEMVAVDYYGALMADGKLFDSSLGRGEKLRFMAGAGQMIKGWDEAMLLLGHGDKAILFIPYTLAYGEAGRPPIIPEKSNLAFYIEIE